MGNGQTQSGNYIPFTSKSYEWSGSNITAKQWLLFEWLYKMYNECIACNHIHVPLL